MKIRVVFLFGFLSTIVIACDDACGGLEMLKKQPRIPLIFSPTPLHFLPRVTAQLQGPQIFIKRDDQTGLACGGSKTRKLEFLVADALQKGCDIIVATGAQQSNHCRQTIAACARLGIKCALLLYGIQRPFKGNSLLNYLLGADIYWKGKKGGPHSLDELGKVLSDQGYKPYLIPVGGANVIGALGCVQEMVEIMEQLTVSGQSISHIVVPSCSLVTQVGLVVGAYCVGFQGKIVGISIEIYAEQKEKAVALQVRMANKVANVLGIKKVFTPEDFILVTDYSAQYGKVGDLERTTITYLASTEGILLDPVYTGRAFGGLLDMIKKGQFTQDDSILFIHTGGTPALFAYAYELTHAQDTMF